MDLVALSDQAMVDFATRILMVLSYNAGLPLVATSTAVGEGGADEQHGVVIAFTGSADALDEVIELMAAKFPNAKIETFRDQAFKGATYTKPAQG